MRLRRSRRQFRAQEREMEEGIRAQEREREREGQEPARDTFVSFATTNEILSSTNIFSNGRRSSCSM